MSFSVIKFVCQIDRNILKTFVRKMLKINCKIFGVNNLNNGNK